MQKWSNGAKKRKIAIDAADVKSKDLDVIVSTMAALPSGLLKKVLTDDVIAILNKYGVVLNE